MAMVSLLSHSLCAFFTSFLCSVVLTPVCKNIAFRFKILDIPDGSVKAHAQPTPYLGGVAIWVSFFISCLLFVPLGMREKVLLIASFGFLLLGLFDDIIRFEPHHKLLGQIIIISYLLSKNIYLSRFFLSINPAFNRAVTFFWLLLGVNALNLLDVMDGLATTVAGLILLSFLFLSLFCGYFIHVVFICAILGALFGFLIYNFPPAKIYMGDAGSLSVGCIVSIIPLLFNWKQYPASVTMVPILILAILLIEVGMLISLRTYKKTPFFKPTPDHLYMYLRAKGLSKKQVLLFIIVSSIVFSILSFLFILSLSIYILCLALAVALLYFTGIIYYIYFF